MTAFEGWGAVADRLRAMARTETERLNEGQRASVRVLADRLPSNGMILADEVGMGKTRIAVALIRAVAEAGGRTAVLVPPGLGYQWGEELRDGALLDAPPIVRSLWSYLAAWEEGASPWFARPVVLLSHAFANWRLGGRSQRWRWELLPLLHGMGRKRAGQRAPRGFNDLVETADCWTYAAAGSIVEYAFERDDAAGRLMREIVDETRWSEALVADNYASGEALREPFERAVGLGLGPFDLVVLDEAHKSRGAGTGLSRLLERILLPADGARRLTMTATPVELDVSQWREILERVRLPEEAAQRAESAIARYAEAVRRVRATWQTSEEARRDYEAAAAAFEAALSPCLLRRDKREDEAVRRYAEEVKRRYAKAAGGVDGYREEREVKVGIGDLSPRWRRAVVAAEALSLVTRHATDPAAKRLRLTLGNGHGIASLIDQLRRDEEADALQGEEDRAAEATAVSRETSSEPVGTEGETKRHQRAAWWHAALHAAVGSEEGLHDHPAIRAAVAEIERYHEESEKVLVFGRFTRPMRTMVELLNAREMIRRLDGERAWPARRVAKEDVPAVRAALRQLGRHDDLKEIDRRLEARYATLEVRRERLREHLFDWVEDVGGEEGDIPLLLRAARKDARTRDHLVAAVDELLGPRREPTPEATAEAFAALVGALRDRDEGDADGEGRLDEDEAGDLWVNLAERLEAEYGVQRGRFARLMNGATPQASRRMMQLAFNRPENALRVLVAQSVVGREGLNLHGACRVVLLLHPEWNPGVVEQQIGRVDRVGSHWSKALDAAIAEGTLTLPRIEVRPVVFKGTYDEHHWQVLRERWDDLRAQLHGIVVPHRSRIDACGEARKTIDRLDKAAPNFSPSAATIPKNKPRSTYEV